MMLADWIMIGVTIYLVGAGIGLFFSQRTRNMVFVKIYLVYMWPILKTIDVVEILLNGVIWRK